MKKSILASALFFVILSLDAKEVTDTFNLSFTNVEIFHQEIAPAFKVDSHISNIVDFTVMYANNLITKSSLERPMDVKNPKAQNLYLSMNYKF
ncbi:MAG: hypothetical protein GXO30_09080 [Epsilonproteobacteria bacterium]|nr:hypothetical protein [Campylobacterota bacterium]